MDTRAKGKENWKELLPTTVLFVKTASVWCSLLMVSVLGCVEFENCATSVWACIILTAWTYLSTASGANIYVLLLSVACQEDVPLCATSAWGLHHIDRGDVPFNKRMMEVVLSKCWVGANVFVFATDINVYNGEFHGSAINRYSCVRRRRLRCCR